MMAEPSVERLAEVFKCFICLEKLKDTHLCPYCSKPCCYDCIQRWLIEKRSQCPHCKANLLRSELVYCRWVEDVTHQLDTLQQVEDNGKKELCKTHNEKLAVFCLTCGRCICPQCALWDWTHTNHVFRPLDEIWLLHVVKIEEELVRSRKRLSELKDVINRMEKDVAVMRSAKNERVEEIIHSKSQMISLLTEQLKKKLSILIEHKDLWSKEYSKIESILKSIEQQVKMCSKSELLLHIEKIIQSISEFKCKPINNFENLYAAIDTEFPCEIIPPYDGSTFVISNFSILQLTANPVYSSPLQASGLAWRLKVYPAGTSNERGKYLSVFFELCSGFPETSKYQYKVEMVHKESGDSSKAVIRESASEFDAGHCWGFNRFYRLDLLAGEGYLNTEDDTLILDFQVRSLSYYQKCKNQERYINWLQTTQDQYTKQIDDLKEQLNESLRNQSTFSNRGSSTLFL